jgi:hypothetical protein
MAFVVMLSVIYAKFKKYALTLNVIKLNIFILRVVLLSVVAPLKQIGVNAKRKKMHRFIK